MEILLIIVGIMAIIVGIMAIIVGILLHEGESRHILGGLITAACGIMLTSGIGVYLFSEARKPIIIQKSPDTEWELSEAYHIERDTCITEIRIVNQTDTVYPTTCYKILRK